MFKKGQSGNPAGKKPGTKDKKWARIQTFWDMFMETWDQLTPRERAHYSFEGVKLHFERAMAHLPTDQDESLVNAIAAQKMIKALEDDAALNPSPAPAGS